MSLLSVYATFQWNVQNSLNLFREFAWQVGDGVYYWYRVESKKLPGSCYGLCPDTSFNEVLTVMATSVKGLARQLKKQRYNKPIGRVHKWTRPVLECDIKREEAAGIDLSCPTFILVDYCIPEMLEFLEGSDSCKTETIETFVSSPWYTVYRGIDPSPAFVVGGSLNKGQIVGTIATQISTTYLDFGLCDFQHNSFDVSDLYALPHIGWAPKTVVTTLTADQTDAILATMYWPVDIDYCGWAENAILISHSMSDTNFMTWVCDPCVGYTTPSHIQTIPDPNLIVAPEECHFVIGRGPSRPTEGAYVFCASGGSSVNSTVYEIGPDYLVVMHEWVGPKCCKGGVEEAEQIAAAPMSFFTEPAQELVQKLKPMSNMVRTEVSGYLPMSLDIEVSLPQFGKDKLCYSATNDSWQKQKLLQGGNKCLCELSSRTRSGSSFWHLTFRMVKKDKRSELVVTFFPNNFRQSGNYSCEFTLKNKAIECDVSTQSVVVKDELGIFKSPVKFSIKA